MLNGYREYTLDNGLIVALQNFPGRNIRGKLRINLGAYHEKPGEEGLAHFVEHGASFGGSRRFSPEEVADKLEDLGDFDHTTSLGRTTYDYMFAGEDLTDWLGFVSDIVFYPKFDKGVVESERKTIVREIMDRKSSPSFPRNRQLLEKFYRDHPIKIDVAGNENVVANADVDDLRRIHSRGYNASSSDLILVGSLPGNIENLIEESFANIPEGTSSRVEFPELAPLDKRDVLHFSAPEMINLDNPEESSADVHLYFPAPSKGTKESFPLDFLDRVIGGDTRSRLFRRLRVKEGLAYSVHSDSTGDYNAGALIVKVSVPARAIDKSLSIIKEELDKLKDKGVSGVELEKARKKFRFGLNRCFDSNGGVLRLIEYKLDYGITADEANEKYDAVTVDDVKSIARKYLTDNHILFIVDPLKE